MRKKKPFSQTLSLSILTAISLGYQNLASASPTKEYDTSCEIAIIGAGAGGIHTAYRLAASYESKLCVFEKEDRVGGRFYDIALDAEAEKQGKVIGNGARRIMEGQNVLFDLAHELGITYEAPLTGADVIFAKGRYETVKDNFFDLYPHLPVNWSEKDYEDQLVNQLIQSKLREQIASFASFKDYGIAVLGESGFAYLRDMSRFHGDFEYPISASSYVDWLEEEITYCCQTYYPHGGMSAFTDRMHEKILAQGARVFLNEPVTHIDKHTSRYIIKTSSRQLLVDKVIVAVPPSGFEKISGSISEKIKASDQFKSILPVRVTVINQWYDSAWWLNIRTKENEPIWRAYTTIDTNHLDGRCIGFVEFAPESAAIEQKAIRAVYNDNKECAQMWSELNAEGDYEKRDTLIREGLQFLLEDNGVSSKITVPYAVKTTFWEWEAAWHWLAAGSKFTNKDVFEWAVEPLKGEDVSLVGEAYNPQRSTWSDAAYKSSIHLLEKKFGM